ncbi:MAG TPA: helix-turn-helix domain-containing protein [Mycobacteriales bacterium]|nr:helix-turn-helix domain-containing protein [Mycobacteriales bacterium]
MTVRVERADAARNRKAILEAADRLFASANSPSDVSMDDVAAAAGVGKGTLFRRFGDRASLIRQLYAARLAPLRDKIGSGPPPLGPSTAPRERVAAIIDAIALVKLQNSHLMLALEDGGGPANDIHRSPDYRDVHRLIADLLIADTDRLRADWTAHVLLACVRADLLRHLTETEGMSQTQIRANLRNFIEHTLSR